VKTKTTKTAISVPDLIFDRATKRAIELGISRSEFFSIAARRYLDELDDEALTRQIDAAVDLAGDDDSSAAAVAAGRIRLAADGEEW
jgi:metal-responsive CopG/Arc/MetJ family transcriptional regulator